MGETDDDRLTALQNLLRHGPQVLSATEVLDRAAAIIGERKPQ